MKVKMRERTTGAAVEVNDEEMKEMKRVLG